VTRTELAEELALARSIELATMPAEEDEPGPGSMLWPGMIGATLLRAQRERESGARRDLVVLAGARVIGWLEAIDEARLKT
jgi:hypothetical protein